MLPNSSHLSQQIILSSCPSGLPGRRLVPFPSRTPRRRGPNRSESSLCGPLDRWLPRAAADPATILARKVYKEKTETSWPLKKPTKTTTFRSTSIIFWSKTTKTKKILQQPKKNSNQMLKTNNSTTTKTAKKQQFSDQKTNRSNWLLLKPPPRDRPRRGRSRPRPPPRWSPSLTSQRSQRFQRNGDVGRFTVWKQEKDRSYQDYVANIDT